MFRVVFIIFAVVLFTLAFYITTHQHQGFLGIEKLSEATQRELGRFAVVFIIAGLLALAAGILLTGWLEALALIVSALAAGILGLRVPTYLKD
ncbi:hypothetical protein [Lacticaseibacillus camelliae]|uniref:Uncharacterized protein n=1 Tax=Lacticaseibacillus camelliae DSM 22697 = JCM 13995 TaxID=1423730 RepID=A0A0R2FJ59_9LACO|nr:hypothetical protein [Lacticaseibacillus camelliae]KRN25079.1 hypothetical protein FC75_GL000992 [Lacticaseibacillus camelliae DSM 22697 = JCM 13995]